MNASSLPQFWIHFHPPTDPTTMAKLISGAVRWADL